MGLTVIQSIIKLVYFLTISLTLALLGRYKHLLKAKERRESEKKKESKVVKKKKSERRKETKQMLVMK